MESKVISTRVNLETFSRINAVADRLYAKSYTGQPNRTQLLMDAINLFCDLAEDGALDGMNLSQIKTADIVYSVNNRKKDVLIEIRDRLTAIDQKLGYTGDTEDDTFSYTENTDFVDDEEDWRSGNYQTLEGKEKFERYRTELVEVWEEPSHPNSIAESRLVTVKPRWEAENYIERLDKNSSAIDDYPMVNYIIREHIEDTERQSQGEIEQIDAGENLNLAQAYELAQSRGYDGSKKSFSNSFTRNKNIEDYQNYDISRVSKGAGKPAVYIDRA